MATNTSDASPTEFTTRRAALVSQIGDSLEQVLQQMNALNRSLEGIIEIGNEFASVEALWSQFETVMGKHADGEGATGNDETETTENGESGDQTEDAGDGDMTVQQNTKKPQR